jgi:ferredoxin
MRCGPACPTEALRPVFMQEAGMGLAYLDRKRCVDYQTSSGVMCWTCYERCPLKSSAIYLRNGYIPTVDKDKCVGCGVCEYVCPIQAITVTPARMLPGKDKTQGAAAKDKGPDAQKAGIKELAVKLARLILGKGAGGA